MQRVENIGEKNHLKPTIFQMIFLRDADGVSTNRTLAAGKVTWEWQKPFDILAKKSPSTMWRNILDLARTYYIKQYTSKDT